VPRIYALLVGINDYAAVSKLAGCVADIEAVEALLRKRVPSDQLSLKVLHDGAATRAGIIDGFRTHLTQATADDIAAFYFCGHGSQEPCPPEWVALEPSGTNQTIVPVDARVGDTFDIADKELSALIHEVAANGAHVVTLFDSCHSGGVTRDVDEGHDPASGISRTAPASTMRARTMDDYLESARTLYDPTRTPGEQPPAPAHIAIAACQFDQLAKEFPMQAPRRGAFTQAFEEAVNTLGPSATYIDLVTAIRTKVRERAKDQMPNLAAVGGASGSTVFLGGHAGRSDLTVNADARGAWWLSAGAVDGVPTPDAGHTTEVAIFARDLFQRDGAKAEPAARATVAVAEADRARLTITSGTLDVAQIYTGVITKLASVPLHVTVTGSDPDTVAKIRETLVHDAFAYTVVDKRTDAVPTITVVVAPDGVTCLGDDGVALENLRFGAGDADLNGIAVACAHMATWYGIRDRVPVGSTLNGKVQIELVPATKGETAIPDSRAPFPAPNGVVTLTPDGSEPPRMQVRLRNTSGDRLYVTLLDLSDSFECSVVFSDWIPANSVAFAFGGRPQKLPIPAWRAPTFTVGTEYLKIVASLTEFMAAHYAMESLLAPGTGGTRAFVEEVDEASTWGTTNLTVKIHR
jgi:hypothetical protein